MHDVNQSRAFELASDDIPVGHTVTMSGGTIRWEGTVLVIDFHDVKVATAMPEANDTYRVSFKRPFAGTDSVLFKVSPAVESVAGQITMGMSSIEVMILS